jgi:hypothetical protein
MKPLSQMMQDALEAIKAHGGKVVPQGGGFWGWEGDSATYSFSTTTVYALTDRFILRRTNEARQPWRDTYELNPEHPLNKVQP